MPYSTTSELPADVQKLPAHEQQIFLSAFNAAFAGTCKDEANRESCAMAVAHAAVNKQRGAKSASARVGEMLKALGVFLAGGEALDSAADVDAILERATKGERVRLTREARICKADEERHLIYAVVYEPDVEDAHGDGMTAPEIEKAAHSFMQGYAQMRAEAGLEHQVDVARDALAVVESFIAPAAFRLGKQDVKPGTWVMVTKAIDDTIWQGVKDGTYTGYSFEGWGRRVPVNA